MRWYFTSTQSAHHNPFETTGATKHAKIQMKNWNHLSLPANVGATMLPSTLHPHAKSKLQYMTYPLCLPILLMPTLVPTPLKLTVSSNCWSKLVSHIDRMLAMLHYSNFTLTSFHTHRTRLGLSTFTKSSPQLLQGGGGAEGEAPTSKRVRVVLPGSNLQELNGPPVQLEQPNVPTSPHFPVSGNPGPLPPPTSLTWSASTSGSQQHDLKDDLDSSQPPPP